MNVKILQGVVSVLFISEMEFLRKIIQVKDNVEADDFLHVETLISIV